MISLSNHMHGIYHTHGKYSRVVSILFQSDLLVDCSIDPMWRNGPYAKKKKTEIFHWAHLDLHKIQLLVFRENGDQCLASIFIRRFFDPQSTTYLLRRMVSNLLCRGFDNHRTTFSSLRSLSSYSISTHAYSIALEQTTCHTWSSFLGLDIQFTFTIPWTHWNSLSEWQAGPIRHLPICIAYLRLKTVTTKEGSACLARICPIVNASCFTTTYETRFSRCCLYLASQFFHWQWWNGRRRLRSHC